MSVTIQYYSEAKKKKKRKKQEISQLAKDSFEAFKPFINVYDCGISYDNSPIHLIAKEVWRLHARYKKGEKNLTYPDGSKFNPYLDVVRNIYSPKHVHEHLEHGQVSYYTSGRKGYGLLYLDIDAHHAWQTDEQQAKTILQKLFPSAFFRTSRRGQNGYLKVQYASIDEFNRVAGVLEGILKRLFLHRGILCDIEVKGTISYGKSGGLAKLPFTNSYACSMKDETDCWNYSQLKKFMACPILNARRVEYLACQAASQIDELKVRAFAAHKRAIDEKTRRDLIERVAKAYAEGTIESIPNRSEIELNLSISCPLCGSHKFGLGRYQYVCARCGRGYFTAETTIVPVSPGPSVTDLKPPASSQERGLRPIRERRDASRLKIQLDNPSTEDAFARNHTDIKPFVRAFYKQTRRYPTTEETLRAIAP